VWPLGWQPGSRRIPGKFGSGFVIVAAAIQVTVERGGEGVATKCEPKGHAIWQGPRSSVNSGDNENG